MLVIQRLLVVVLLSVGITAATTAQSAVQLFTAQWYTESFGNECAGSLTPSGAPGPHCTITTGEFAAYSNWAMPQGILCNQTQPRCPFSSTPTDGKGAFHPLGGKGNPTMPTSINCAPLSVYMGTTMTTRPAKGGTVSPRVPPLYRNPFFFTTSGQPKLTACDATSTGYTTGTQTRFGANKGKVQLGHPVAGSWNASVTASGGFSFAAAPATGPGGFRTTGLVGEFTNTYPYIYSYTYATLRNDAGVFGPGKGPGSFVLNYPPAAGTYVAGITVKQGPAKFGGTMKMLGALTTKVCYWLQAGGGGCSLGNNDWLYHLVGASASTSSGVVTMGYTYTHTEIYYNTANGQTSLLTVVASRFPWTTGTVTVTAIGRGPHKTVHYAQGYDNRNTTTGLGKGTIQLVTPILTRWFGYADFETGGIGVLRIEFVPEPQTWMMLVAGASLLGLGYRMRGR